jgi:hypothetical protein
MDRRTFIKMLTLAAVTPPKFYFDYGKNLWKAKPEIIQDGSLIITWGADGLTGGSNPLEVSGNGYARADKAKESVATLDASEFQWSCATFEAVIAFTEDGRVYDFRKGSFR